MFHDVSLVFWEIREILYLSFFSTEPFCWSRLETTVVAAMPGWTCVPTWPSWIWEGHLGFISQLPCDIGVAMNFLLDEELKNPESPKSQGSQSFSPQKLQQIVALVVSPWSCWCSVQKLWQELPLEVVFYDGWIFVLAIYPPRLSVWLRLGGFPRLASPDPLSVVDT